MSDAFSKLRGLTNQLKARDEDLRRQFQELNAQMQEASNGYDISGQSKNCLLESYGDDDASYGYLFFSAKLRVAYRSSEDDMQMAFEREPSEPTFSVKDIENCSPIWLRALSSPQILESLLTNINEGLESSIRTALDAAQVLSATANLPLRDLDSGLVDAAKKLNFDDVLQQWRDAQSALGVDPPDATTRACRLLETLCKHILKTKGIPLPGNESIQPLFTAASRSLKFAPEQQSSNDLRAIASGMIALVASVGALRTHAGTAHGTVPGAQSVTFSQARLAVNAAGILSTFLMDTMLVQTQQQQPVAS
jgi:hypothetical protein